MSRVVGFVIVALHLTACSCATDHGLDADADATAQPDATLSDVGEPDWAHFDAGPWDAAGDGGPCDPRVLVEGCTSDQVCAARAAYVAPAGSYPVTQCIGHICQQGMYNCQSHDGNTECFCAPGPAGSLGYLCGAGQLCVSDTPGGPSRCVNACEGR